MKQYIFLDIDGVLNSTKWFNSDKNPGNLNGKEGELDPEAINFLNTITDKTNASIVISSDWKYNWEDTLDRLKNAGVTGKIIGSTPSVADSHRGKEIDLWFKYHAPQDDNYIKYVILDDREDMLEKQYMHLVKVNHDTGLMHNDVEKALMHLIIV